jgi:Holliday junction DNA helicase RuvA
MIASIRGVLQLIGVDHVVINVGGIGIQVYVPSSTLNSLGDLGSEINLQTFLVVRDDAISLFGFRTLEEKRLFELLVGVNGVGPRLALSVLSIMSAEDTASSIVTGNIDALVSVPGIGRRTAGRIVLELQNRMEKEWGMTIVAAQQSHGELAVALGALGYSTSEIQSAIARLGDVSNLTLEDQVRNALQSLGS